MLLYDKFLKKYKPKFFIAIFFLVIESMADLYQPLLISRLVDDGVRQKDLEIVKQIGLIMIGVALIGLFSAVMRNYMATHVSYNFAKDLRAGLYSKVLKLNMIQVEEIERGSIINRLTFDVQQVQRFVNGTMRIFLKAPMLAIGSFFMVLQLDKRFFYIYLVVIPIIVIIIMINIKVGYPLFAKIQVQLDQLNKKTIEYLNGIRVVKAFNRSKYENRNFEKVNEKLKHVSNKAFKVMAIFNPLNMLVINMCIVVVLFLSQSWMGNSRFGVGQIIAFINYMTQLLFAISIMSRVFHMYIRAKTSNTRIVEILEAEENSVEIWAEDNKSAEDNRSAKVEHILKEDMEKGLRVEALSFRFGEGEYALKDINFYIPHGKSLGIIGATGSGKTTLAQLLIGLLEPTKGKITIGDKTMNKINVDSYRELVGYVPQDMILFSDSVINNIKIGNDKLKDKESEWFIKKGATEFVFDMEDGLNTLLGKGGVNISGGQKQRLSLVRALVKKPKLLLLDDSTSALDAITEKRIFDQLKDGSVNASYIVIGQKISTVRHMDQILVLNNGEMVGLGKHEDLLSECQTYQDFYNIQMGVTTNG